MSCASIRQARRDEAARLCALMRETFITANGHCSSPENVEALLDATCTVPRQRAELDDPDRVTLIAQADNGDWAGYAQLRFATAPRHGVTLARPVELGRLYLLPRFLGQGLGTALLQRLIAQARRRGGDGLWLGAWQEATRAIAFYLRHGFLIVGRTEFSVGDDRKPNWVMQKRFAAGHLDAGRLAG
jgi:GNAT superfamily N-acetyltransferase